LNARQSTTLLIFIVLALAACTPSEPAATPDVNATPPAVSTPTLAATPTREAAPDLSGETIPLYHLCGQAGSNAAFNQSKILAARDMVAAINVGGGIFGAQLDLEFIDTGGDEDVARSAYARMRRLHGDILLLILCDAATEQALAPLLSDAGLPALGPGTLPASEYEGEDGWLFAYNTPVEAQFAYWLDYATEHWGAVRPAGVGDEMRIALVGWPAEEGMHLPEGDWEATFGVEIVMEVELSVSGESSIFDVVYEARDRNVNAFYVTAGPRNTAELLNAVNALGLDERFLVAGPSFVFESNLAPYLFGPEFAAGAYSTASAAGWDQQERSGVEVALGIFAANERAEDVRDGAYLSMLGAVDIARRSLEDAILDSGYEELDAAGLRAALANLGDYGVLLDLYEIDFGESRFPQALQLRALGEDSAEQTLIQDFASFPDLAPILDTEE